MYVRPELHAADRPTYVAIVGSRSIGEATYHQIFDAVAELPDRTIVVSGAASGTDEAAVAAARARGIATVEYGIFGKERPRVQRREGFGNEWSKWEPCVGFCRPQSMRDALIFRNTLIAMECDYMIAFVVGSQGGTWDAVAQAEKRFKRPVQVVK